jgi:hypothetical protein
MTMLDVNATSAGGLGAAAAGVGTDDLDARCRRATQMLAGRLVRHLNALAKRAEQIAEEIYGTDGDEETAPEVLQALNEAYDRVRFLPVMFDDGLAPEEYDEWRAAL